MAKARAKSIPVGVLSQRVEAAVASALKSNARFADLLGPIGIFPNPIIVGLILRERDFSGRSVSEINKFAADIAGGIKGAGDPVAFFKDKNIIVGYWPGPDIFSLAK
jgi:hypothetical protein